MTTRGHTARQKREEYRGRHPRRAKHHAHHHDLVANRNHGRDARQNLAGHQARERDEAHGEESFRVTAGVKRNGSRFELCDSWKDGGLAHRELPFEWRGTTAFFTRASKNQVFSDDTEPYGEKQSYWSTCLVPEGVRWADVFDVT